MQNICRRLHPITKALWCRNGGTFCKHNSHRHRKASELAPNSASEGCQLSLASCGRERDRLVPELVAKLNHFNPTKYGIRSGI
jgi:hypothetical protein